MDQARFERFHHAWHRIRRVWRCVQKPILVKHELTKMEGKMLFALRKLHQPTKGEIADFLEFEPSSITRSLDRLVDREIVERVVDPHDKRYVRLSLTKEGEVFIKSLRKEFYKVWQCAFKNLPEIDVELFCENLEKLTVELGGQRELEG